MFGISFFVSLNSIVLFEQLSEKMGRKGGEAPSDGVHEKNRRCKSKSTPFYISFKFLIIIRERVGGDLT